MLPAAATARLQEAKENKKKQKEEERQKRRDRKTQYVDKNPTSERVQPETNTNTDTGPVVITEILGIKTTLAAFVESVLAQASREKKQTFFTTADVTYLCLKKLDKLNTPQVIWKTLQQRVSTELNKTGPSRRSKASSNSVNGVYVEFYPYKGAKRARGFRVGFAKIEAGVTLDTVQESKKAAQLQGVTGDPVKQAMHYVGQMNSTQITQIQTQIQEIQNDKVLSLKIQLNDAKKALETIKNALGVPV